VIAEVDAAVAAAIFDSRDNTESDNVPIWLSIPGAFRTMVLGNGTGVFEAVVLLATAVFGVLVVDDDEYPLIKKKAEIIIAIITKITININLCS
jgi:hypothetical protein